MHAGRSRLDNPSGVASDSELPTAPEWPEGGEFLMTSALSAAVKSWLNWLVLITTRAGADHDKTSLAGVERFAGDP